MSEMGNTEIVQQVYSAFSRKDLPAILELQADDAHWSVVGSAKEIPWATPSPGHDGVTEFLKILGEWLVAEQFEILEYLATGDTVVALGYQRGFVRPTRTPYEFEFVHVWKLRTGKIASFCVYYDTAYVASVLRDTRAR